MDPGTRTDEEAALERALVYRLLSRSYRYPDAEGIGTLRQLLDAVRLALPEDGEVGAAMARFASLYRGAAAESIEAAHIATLGHAPQGPSPAYEAEYGEGEEPLQMPHELGDLAGFYRAFGLQLDARSGERVDFLAVELEFMEFLCRKEAHGHEIGQADLAAVAVEGQTLFLKRHLGRWLPTFARRVIDRGVDDLPTAQAAFALAWIQAECERRGFAPGSERLRLRQDFSLVEACKGCDAAAEQGEIEV